MQLIHTHLKWRDAYCLVKDRISMLNSRLSLLVPEYQQDGQITLYIIIDQGNIVERWAWLQAVAFSKIGLGPQTLKPYP